MIGAGEMGGVFARGFLKLGYPVYPVTRDMDLETVASQVSDVESVVVSVGEKDIQSILEQVPAVWRDKLVLLQNELLPNDWLKCGIKDPTVISVWFEKKPGQDYKVIIPSPVFGPQAGLINQALGAINIPTNVLNSDEELLSELVIKNVYILTTNIAGLQVGGNVGALWSEHQETARAVANDVMDIQFKLIEQELDRDRLIDGMVRAFDGDLEHKCMGRSAPGRLERALKHAQDFSLEAKCLQSIGG